jgi:hypothetical protein
MSSRAVAAEPTAEGTAPERAVEASPGRGWERALAVALLLLLPLAGEAALRQAPTALQAYAGLGYLVAVLAFALLAGSAPAPSAGPAVARRGPARRALLAGALGLALLGVGLAWSDPRQWLLAPIWLAGIGLWLIGWRGGDGGRARPTGAGFWAAVLSLAVAAALRLFALPNLQPVQIDELVMTEGSLRRGTESIFAPHGLLLFAPNAADGFSQLRESEYLRLVGFLLGGINMLSLRLPSVGVGLLEIGLVFLLGRELFSLRVGLVAAALMATSNAHLTFSRHGSIYLEGSLAWTVVALCLARGLARRSAGWLAMAGLALASALYLYQSARPSPVWVVALLLLAAFDRSVRGRWLAVGALALLGGFVVGAGPILAAYIKDPSIYLYRTEVTTWLGRAIAAFLATGDPSKLLPLWEHLRTALLGYNLVGSRDNHYLPDRGLFLWLPAGLLFAGLALATLRPFRWRYALLALWFWAVTLGISALSEATPPGQRILPVLPAAAVLIGLALDRLLAAWSRLGARAGRIASAVALLGLGLTIVLEGAFYFGDYAHRDFDRWQDQLTRFTLAAPDGQHIAVVPGPSPMGMELNAEGKPFQWASNLQRRVTGESVGRVVDQVPYLAAGPGGVTYLVHGGLSWWADVLRRAYPGAAESRLLSTDASQPDRLAWLVLRVDPEQAAAQRGLSLTIVDSRGVSVNRPVDGVDFDGGQLPPETAFPVRLEWRGWVRPARRDNEPLVLQSRGSVGPTVRLGDLRLDLATAPTARANGPLPQGGQPLYAAAELPNAGGSVRVTWDGQRPGEQVPFAVGASARWPGPPRVLVEWLGPNGEPVKREYDVMIADRRIGLRRTGPGPYRIRWRATLLVAPAGPREFDLSTNVPSRLLIDDRVVWPLDERAPGTPSRVDLSAGAHSVVVERQLAVGELALLWRQGDGPFEIVPEDAFAPLSWP